MKTRYEHYQDKPDVSGRIVLDLRMLTEYATYDSTGKEGPSRWQEELSTQVYSFNEIINYSPSAEGLTIRLRPKADGSTEHLFWPWKSIDHFTVHTNTDEEAEMLAEWEQEQQIEAYVEQGTNFIEEILNHPPGPHGVGCSCPPDEDEFDEEPGDYVGSPIELHLPFGGTVSIGPETPCGHNMAMRILDNTWVCIVCAKRWNEEGDLL